MDDVLRCTAYLNYRRRKRQSTARTVVSIHLYRRRRSERTTICKWFVLFELSWVCMFGRTGAGLYIYSLQAIFYFSKDNTTVEPENGHFWPLNTTLLAPMPPPTQTNAQTPLMGTRRTPFDTSPARIAQFSKIVPTRDDPRAIVPCRDEISMIEYLALFSIALYFFGGILREKGAGKIKELALYSFRPPAPAMKNKRASSS